MIIMILYYFFHVCTRNTSLHTYTGIDRDATSQILSCLPPATRDIVMLSLTMEASSLGQRPTTYQFDQSYQQVQDQGQRQILQEEEDDGATINKERTNVFDNNDDDATASGNIDIRKFSLALMPVVSSTAVQGGIRSSSAFISRSSPPSGIFKASIFSPPPSSNTRRRGGPNGESGSFDDLDEENTDIVVNTVDLSSIPLLEAPKIDDDGQIESGGMYEIMKKEEEEEDRMVKVEVLMI